ncbi:MAG: exodeoxyribonuclease VII small subunit [Verrucomicrobiota bacterium]|nr:exodeoxyribonuclease VII small subunit [Verrucomicrobiota bacterium]
MTMVKKTGAAPAHAKSKDKPGFEQALERLETIVAEMERSSLGLEDMLARFEEGRQLIKFCSQKLNEVEKKIEVLVKKGDEVVTEPFEAAPEEGDGNGEVDKAAGEGKAPF